MILRHTLVVVLFVVVGCKAQTVYTYPKISNVKVEESHHGQSYTNKFSNLESDNTQVSDWFQRQDSIAESYFNSKKEFELLFERYDSLENRSASPPAGSLKRIESGDTYYLSSLESANSDVLFRRSRTDSAVTEIFNPESYKDGSYQIVYYAPSYDGNYTAIALGKDGEFFNETIIFDNNGLKAIGEPITQMKPLKAGGIVWSFDSRCISYITYPNSVPVENDRNSFTSLSCIEQGTLSTQAIFKDGIGGISLNEEYYPIPKIRSAHDNYVFIYAGNASDFWDCYYLPKADFESRNFDWKLLYSASDRVQFDYGEEKNHRYFYRRVLEGRVELCSVDLRKPDFANPQILYAGNAENQLGSFRALRDRIVYTVKTNGISESLYEIKSNQEVKKIELPHEAGDIYLDYVSPYEEDLWVTLAGWTTNPREYHLDSSGEFRFVELGRFPEYPEYENLVSEVIEVESHDGSVIPLSIVRRKDFEPNGTAMGIITAYGAYGTSQTPWFHAPIADFVNRGNIYATAHVRGGGEKGPSWHEAGKMSTKANSWKDLNACSSYLIENGYVHSKKLGLNVNSAGGITGGMAVNERPDLYGVYTGFLPQSNIIRIENLEDYDDSDIAFEFGTIKDEEGYQNLLAMDPVVNLYSEKEYPSTLFIIGQKDYLVPPSTAARYIALLQSFNESRNDKPYLLDVKYGVEHEVDWVGDYAKMLFFTMKELEKRD